MVKTIPYIYTGRQGLGRALDVRNGQDHSLHLYGDARFRQGVWKRRSHRDRPFLTAKILFLGLYIWKICDKIQKNLLKGRCIIYDTCD